MERAVILECNKLSEEEIFNIISEGHAKLNHKGLIKTSFLSQGGYDKVMACIDDTPAEVLFLNLDYFIDFSEQDHIEIYTNMETGHRVLINLKDQTFTHTEVVDANMTIGQRIEKARLDKGLSIEDLIELTDQSRASLYRYEKDQVKNVPLAVLQDLSVALDVSLARLTGDESAMVPINLKLNDAIQKRIAEGLSV